MRERRQRGKRRRRRRRPGVESKEIVVHVASSFGSERADRNARRRRRRRRAERVADDIARARQRASQVLCAVAVAVADEESNRFEFGFRAFSSRRLVVEFGDGGGQRRFGRLGATPRGRQRRLALPERLRQFRARAPRRRERGDVIALLDQARLFGVVHERHARLGFGCGLESARVAGSIPAGRESRQHRTRRWSQRGRPARSFGSAVAIAFVRVVPRAREKPADVAHGVGHHVVEVRSLFHDLVALVTRESSLEVSLSRVALKERVLRGDQFRAKRIQLRLLVLEREARVVADVETRGWGVRARARRGGDGRARGLSGPERNVCADRGGGSGVERALRRRRRARNAEKGGEERRATGKGARLDAGGRTSTHPRARAGVTRPGFARGRVGSTRARRRRGGERSGQSGRPARIADAAVRAAGVAAPTAMHVDRAEPHDRRAVVEGADRCDAAATRARRRGAFRTFSLAEELRQQATTPTAGWSGATGSPFKSLCCGFEAADRFRVITMNRAERAGRRNRRNRARRRPTSQPPPRKKDEGHIIHSFWDAGFRPG